MPAAYDNYDYPSYWTNRQYEHASEITAIKSLLKDIPRIRKIIDIGAGYGRLVSAYSYRAQKIVLTDPSAKLLSQARSNFKSHKNFKFIQSTLDHLDKKIKIKKFDLAIMVRVLHHIHEIDSAFMLVNKLLVYNGYLILEFANKRNIKAIVRHFLGGDLTFPMEIQPVDLRTKKNKKDNTLPFINYHPDQIIQKLESANFEILQTLSVSNIRSTYLKRTFPINLLNDLEKILQKPLSGIKFGPSVFLLARKRG